MVAGTALTISTTASRSAKIPRLSLKTSPTWRSPPNEHGPTRHYSRINDKYATQAFYQRIDAMQRQLNDYKAAATR